MMKVQKAVLRGGLFVFGSRLLTVLACKKMRFVVCSGYV